MSFYKHKDIALEYCEFGSGEELMFAFHGFNRDFDDFRIFTSSLGTKYRIISFNLFYHGKTQHPETKNYAFTKEELGELIKTVLNEKGKDRFSLLAYSLGGKIALSCIELFPAKVKDVFLLAPDGIKINFWYKLMSHFWLGQKLFFYFLNHTDKLLKILYFLKDKGIINERLLNFAVYYLSSKERRTKVYNVWIIFRKLVPDIKFIQKSINKYKINLHMFFGKYDVVIPPEIGTSFFRNLPNKSGLHILDTGHNLINERMNTYLKKIVNEKA